MRFRSRDFTDKFLRDSEKRTDLKEFFKRIPSGPVEPFERLFDAYAP